MTINKLNKLAFVVSDDPVERENLSVILKRGDFEVEAFPAEEPAVAALQHTSPHVAVVHFGENLGRTVNLIERLYSVDSTVCILYPTFYQGGNLYSKAIAAGAYAIIPKPHLYDGKFNELLKTAWEESRNRKRAAAGKSQALVLMPFAKSFDELYKVGIKEPLEALGYRCERIDEMFFIGNVVQKLIDKIGQSQLIIADLSGHNPNVFYETGFADALDKTVVLLANSATNIPFNVQGRRFIVYDDILTLRRDLDATIRALMHPEA